MTRKRAIAEVDAGTARFDAFYIAQFGPAPPRVDWRVVMEEQQRVERLKAQAQRHYEWHARRDAALKAWNAGRRPARSRQ